MKDITENKTFEQKLKDRVKESIGDLMSDEDLSKIVKRGLEETFFKAGVDNSNYHSKRIPPLAEELVTELLKERVNIEVVEYFKSNQEEINTAVKEIVSQGLGKLMMNSITSWFRGDMATLQMNIEQRLRGGNL